MAATFQSRDDGLRHVDLFCDSCLCQLFLFALFSYLPRERDPCRLFDVRFLLRLRSSRLAEDLVRGVHADTVYFSYFFHAIIHVGLLNFL